MTSDITDIMNATGRESIIAVQSLFDDDIGTPHMQESDPFGTLGTLHSAIPDHIQVSYTKVMHKTPLLWLHLVPVHQMLQVRV